MEFWQKILQKLDKKIMILGVLGILFILLGNWQNFFAPPKAANNVEPGERKESSSLNTGQEEAGKILETDLEEILAKIEGVGKIKVRVMLASGKQYEYAYNYNTEKRITEEKDQQGGTRTITDAKDEQEMIIVRDIQRNSERPVVLKELKPLVKGVIVVAEGARDSVVKLKLLQAVQIILEIPVHKAIILPME